jgi:hypothetical protein
MPHLGELTGDQEAEARQALEKAWTYAATREELEARRRRKNPQDPASIKARIRETRRAARGDARSTGSAQQGSSKKQDDADRMGAAFLRAINNAFIEGRFRTAQAAAVRHVERSPGTDGTSLTQGDIGLAVGKGNTQINNAATGTSFLSAETWTFFQAVFAESLSAFVPPTLERRRTSGFREATAAANEALGRARKLGKCEGFGHCDDDRYFGVSKDRAPDERRDLADLQFYVLRHALRSSGVIGVGGIKEPTLDDDILEVMQVEYAKFLPADAFDTQDTDSCPIANSDPVTSRKKDDAEDLDPSRHKFTCKRCLPVHVRRLCSHFAIGYLLATYALTIAWRREG